MVIFQMVSEADVSICNGDMRKHGNSFMNIKGWEICGVVTSSRNHVASATSAAWDL